MDVMSITKGIRAEYDAKVKAEKVELVDAIKYGGIE